MVNHEPNASVSVVTYCQSLFSLQFVMTGGLILWWPLVVFVDVDVDVDVDDDGVFAAICPIGLVRRQI